MRSEQQQRVQMRVQSMKSPHQMYVCVSVGEWMDEGSGLGLERKLLLQLLLLECVVHDGHDPLQWVHSRMHHVIEGRERGDWSRSLWFGRQERFQFHSPPPHLSMQRCCC